MKHFLAKPINRKFRVCSTAGRAPTIDNWMNRPADQAFFVPLFWWLQVTLLTHLLLFSRGPFENLIPRVMSYQKRLAYLDATANSTRTDQKLSTQIQRLQVEQCYDYSYIPLFLLFLTNFEFFFFMRYFTNIENFSSNVQLLTPK